MFFLLCLGLLAVLLFSCAIFCLHKIAAHSNNLTRTSFVTSSLTLAKIRKPTVILHWYLFSGHLVGSLFRHCEGECPKQSSFCRFGEVGSCLIQNVRKRIFCRERRTFVKRTVFLQAKSEDSFNAKNPDSPVSVTKMSAYLHFLSQYFHQKVIVGQVCPTYYKFTCF